MSNNQNPRGVDRGIGTLRLLFALALVCATLAAMSWLSDAELPTVVTPEGSSAPTSTTLGGGVAAATTTAATTTVTEAPTDRVICIDAGHGGGFPGALASYKGETVYEKDITLDVALRAEELLRAKGYTVVLTRSEDKSIINTTDNIADVTARVELAKAKGADILVSIHCNAFTGSGRAWGPIVYYTDADKSYDGGALAEHFAACVTAETASLGVRAARVKADPEYAILKGKGLPTVLFESGFLTDSEELSLMMSDAWRDAMARALAQAAISAPLD